MDKKRTSYDHAGARESLRLPPSAPPQRLMAAIDQETSNPTPNALRSPPKKAVKKERDGLKVERDALKVELEELEAEKEAERGGGNEK